MENTYVEQDDSITVKEFTNIAKASEALALQLHEEAVLNRESLPDDWVDRAYRAYLVNEAKMILEERGESKEPILENHFLIRMKTSE